MSAKRRVLLSWSSGKDSAFALRTLRQDPDVSVVGLLTTLDAAANRVAMHAVRRELVERQAALIGLPLHTIDLPWPCPNAVYESAVRQALAHVDTAFDTVAFGDLFLADIRAYRESQMRRLGVPVEFPLWGRDTTELAQEMITSGIDAIITCVDPNQCPDAWAGRHFDTEFLADAPASVDRCGENGEFHTFVAASPDFGERIGVNVASLSRRDGFVIADLVPCD
ncbi:MAG: ATP-binding protein [Pseudomonadota bacterium]